MHRMLGYISERKKRQRKGLISAANGGAQPVPEKLKAVVEALERLKSLVVEAVQRLKGLVSKPRTRIVDVERAPLDEGHRPVGSSHLLDGPHRAALRCVELVWPPAPPVALTSQSREERTLAGAARPHAGPR